jgi:hypothetical protein
MLVLRHMHLPARFRIARTSAYKLGPFDKVQEGRTLKNHMFSILL